MKSHRSYSDHEIGCYVLGLDMPEHTQDIQARLAQDDAAAARALKWEAYFLGIVDGLPPAPPPAAVIARIQATLGIQDETPTEDARPTPERPDESGVAAAEPSPSRAKAYRRKIGRHPIAIIAAACVAAGLAALVIGASLHHTTSQVVQQPVQLQPQ